MCVIICTYIGDFIIKLSGKEGVCNHMYIYWRFHYKVIKSRLRISSKLCILILFPNVYSQPKKLTVLLAEIELADSSQLHTWHCL